jgi:hypothetical protein
MLHRIEHIVVVICVLRYYDFSYYFVAFINDFSYYFVAFINDFSYYFVAFINDFSYCFVAFMNFVRSVCYDPG